MGRVFIIFTHSAIVANSVITKRIGKKYANRTTNERELWPMAIVNGVNWPEMSEIS
jgi:fatty-acid desaturase